MSSRSITSLVVKSKTLSAPRMRDIRTPHEIIPQDLRTRIIAHYNNLSWKKQQKLTLGLSNNNSLSIYNKPLVVPKDKMVHLIKSQDHERIEDAVERSYEESIKQRRNDISTVDLLMYRSIPYLYHISKRMFHELTTWDSSFSPSSMLDMGHNLGSSVWAAQNYFSESIDDFLIHEHNKSEYSRTLELLNNKYKPYIPNVRVKGAFSMPSSKSYRFDLVTAINYFPFLQDFELQQWIDNVWNQTDNYLIIADISNRYTSHRMSRIRSYFIRKYSDEGHIVAPCPHAMECPMLKKNDVHICKFFTKNVGSFAAKQKMLPEEKQFLHSHVMDYSYLILKRGLKETPSNYARILKPVTHHRKTNSEASQKVLEFTTCNSDGTLWKAKTSLYDSPDLYKHVQSRKPGDVVDQNWWNENFTSLPIGWEARSAEHQIKQRRDKNRERILKQKSGLVADSAEEFVDDNIDLLHQEQNLESFDKKSDEFPNDSNREEAPLWSDQYFNSEDDHLDSISAITDDHNS